MAGYGFSVARIGWFEHDQAMYELCDLRGIQPEINGITRKQEVIEH